MSQAARYPGAQPFTDRPLSRAVFFGRDTESRTLGDLILACRLVVVYAKSGVGKTSLLQAGVAQPLREEGYLPLFVRVNDAKQDPISRVLTGITDAVKAEPIEYRQGLDLSLWHFFKTAEFWRGDHLLTPVLVLDQFEELFTLHDPESRARFLRELGYLVRGVRPAVAERIDKEASINDSPPVMRIVLSLREDYLGSLEEGANNIPQILDHRFRLSPLSIEAAAAALERPARVQHAELQTKPFRFGRGTVDAILKYLSRRQGSTTTHAQQYVEPFHLQLVCQRVEAIVGARQRQQTGEMEPPGEVEVTLADLGGERGLDLTLRDFFKTVVDTIASRRMRSRVRRLCRDYLISPEGRRLSLDRGEIRRILKIDSHTLAMLVDKRLLRADQRADSWYFELSHDSLITPILASRKKQALALGGAGLIGSTMLALTSLGVLVGGPLIMAFAYRARQDFPEIPIPLIIFEIILFLLLGAVMLWMGIAGLRRSVETLNRYTTPLKKKAIGGLAPSTQGAAAAQPKQIENNR